MKLGTYIKANFKDKRYRNILCVTGIIVGIILFINVNLFSLNYESLIFNAFAPLKEYNQIVQRGTSFSRMLPYYSEINESVYDDLKIDPEFSFMDLYPVYFKRTFDYSENKSLNQNIVFGMPYLEMENFFTELELAEGNWPQHENHTVIGYDLKAQYGFNVGDSLLIEGKNYTISGIWKQHESLFDWFILLDIQEAQIQFSALNQLTSIFVRYDKTMEEKIELNVESTHLDLEFLTLNEINELNGNILSRTQRTSVIFMLLTLFSSTLFTTAIIFLNVHDRKREIATLRSIGASRGDIFKLIYGEVIIIAFIALIGVPIGITLYSILTYQFMNITGYLAMTLSRAFTHTLSIITWEESLWFILLHFGSTLIMAGIPYYLVMKNDIQSEIRGS
jgi:ABC-type lipoprotein release transport system permease subunit